MHQGHVLVRRPKDRAEGDNSKSLKFGAPGEIRTHDLCLRRIVVRVSGPLIMRFFDPRRPGTQRQHHAITRTLCGRYSDVVLVRFRGKADMRRDVAPTARSLMTHSGHPPDRTPAVQRTPAVALACYSLEAPARIRGEIIRQCRII